MTSSMCLLYHRATEYMCSIMRSLIQNSDNRIGYCISAKYIGIGCAILAYRVYRLYDDNKIYKI